MDNRKYFTSTGEPIMGRIHGQKPKSGATPIYYTWRNMLARCSKPTHAHYEYYGGRGIKVCDRWKIFINFLADMGERPNGLTLGRINNDGNYEPGNCRWETWLEQARNKRPSKPSTHCKRGHPFSEQNTYIYIRKKGAYIGNPSKHCRMCDSLQKRNARERAR
jgi:hypothetical protein